MVGLGSLAGGARSHWESGGSLGSEAGGGAGPPLNWWVSGLVDKQVMDG